MTRRRLRISLAGLMILIAVVAVPIALWLRPMSRAEAVRLAVETVNNPQDPFTLVGPNSRVVDRYGIGVPTSWHAGEVTRTALGYEIKLIPEGPGAKYHHASIQIDTKARIVRSRRHGGESPQNRAVRDWIETGIWDASVLGPGPPAAPPPVDRDASDPTPAAAAGSDT